LAEQEAAKWVSAAAWSSAFELTALIDGRKLLLAELPPPSNKTRTQTKLTQQTTAAARLQLEAAR